MQHSEDYIKEMPPRTIGGATGNYVLNSEITSNRWVEFAVDSIANGDVGTSTVFISGDAPMGAALDYTGLANNSYGIQTSTSTTKDSAVRGTPYRIPATSTIIINGPWQRITNSEDKVYIRIDAGTNNSCYVTISERIKELVTVPGIALTVHPDHSQQMNIARADAITSRIGATPVHANQERERELSRMSEGQSPEPDTVTDPEGGRIPVAAHPHMRNGMKNALLKGQK
jgi:hypothetical protein